MNIGVFAAETIAVGLVENHRIVGTLHSSSGLQSLPPDAVAMALYDRIATACRAEGSISLLSHP